MQPTESQASETVTAVSTVTSQDAALPEGFDKRLPAGVERQIKVVSYNVGYADSPVFKVSGPEGEQKVFAVRIEGGCELRHVTVPGQPGCASKGSAHLVTDGELLVATKAA